MALFVTSSQLPIGNAISKDVLAGKTFSNSSGVNLVGSMPDNSTRTSNGNVPGLSASSPNVPLRDALDLIVAEGTDGIKRLAMQPPEGYYQGNNASFIGRNASELGNATASDVLSGKTFTSENGIKIAGSIPTTEAEFATRVAYYSPNGDNGAGSYGHVHPPSKYYGNLTNNSWAPEVRLTKQQMFDICDGNILSYGDLYTNSYQYGASSNEHIIHWDYTYGSDRCTYKRLFYMAGFSGEQHLNDVSLTITATLNGVNQPLTYTINEKWTKFAYCIMTINSGDKVFFEVKWKDTVGYFVGIALGQVTLNKVLFT